MKKLCLSFLAICLALAPVFAEMNFSGKLGSTMAVTLPWTKNPGEFSGSRIEAQGKLDVYSGNSSMLLDGQIFYDGVKACNSSDAVTFSCGDGFLGAALKEAWVDYSGNHFGVRLGRQKAAWGKADGIAITDIICPQDNSFLFSDDDKMGIDALRLSYSNDFMVADFFWIPLFTPAALPVNSGNPVKPYVMPDSIFMAGKNFWIKAGDNNNPKAKIWNGEYGLRVSGFFSKFDVSVYGFYGWDDMPLFNYRFNDSLLSATGIFVDFDYKRVMMIGADAAIPAGAVVLRMETAFYPQRYIQKNQTEIFGAITAGKSTESFVRRNQLCSLIGIDWMPGDWTVLAQYYNDVLFGDSNQTERSGYLHGITLTVKRSFLSETLDVSASAILGLNDFDSAFKISADYKISDPLTLSLGTNLFFEGKDKGTYGKYKELSSAYIKAVYNF